MFEFVILGLIGSPEPDVFVWVSHGWQRHEPETSMFDPLSYKTRSGAEKALARAKAEWPELESDIYEWNPTEGVAPLEKYMRHRNKFPGCPTQ